MIQPDVSFSAEVQVIGLVTTIPGQVTQHTLINALDNQLEKQRIDAKFDFSQERYQVKTFCAESELTAFLGESGAFQVTIGRFRNGAGIRLPKPSFTAATQRTAEVRQRKRASAAVLRVAAVNW